MPFLANISSESTSNSHAIATSSTTPILNQIRCVKSSCRWICCCIWFSIGVVLEVAVDEEAAVVWELEVDSLEISTIVEEVAVVGVGRALFNGAK